MIKKFLYMLLIVIFSNVMCGDIEPEPFVTTSGVSFPFEPDLIRAIKTAPTCCGYYKNLTARQIAVYKSQMDKSIIIDSWSKKFWRPIEYVICQNYREAEDWLIKNQVDVKNSDALKRALIALPLYPQRVSALLDAGAITDGLLIKRRLSLLGSISLPPLDYMQATLLMVRKARERNPVDGDDNLRSIEATIEVLKAHERWSPERATWCGAVARAELHVRAKVAGPVIYSVGLGCFVVGAPSDRESELK